MSERVKTYFAMLKALSSKALDHSAIGLAVCEKQNTARLIAHIAEIGERDYHLELGCPSLFQYCVERLNLSEGAVYRRTQVAGVCRSFPQILEALFSGRLHLTAASLIATHLTEDNVEGLIKKVEGRTKREIEKLLVLLAPKEEFKSSIRHLATGVELTSDLKTSEERTEIVPPLEDKARPPSAKQSARDIMEAATEEIYNFRFSAGTEFTEKLKRLAEVLGIANPHRHLEELLYQAIEIALEKKAPERKLARRQKREAKKQSPRPGEVKKEKSETEKRDEVLADSPAVTRKVPEEVRERVLERSGYQCEYRGPDGTRCTCRTDLEVEHMKPFAVYHTHDEEYLRAFCQPHNLFVAKQYYGREFIQKKIDGKRHEKAERSRVELSDTTGLPTASNG